MDFAKIRGYDENKIRKMQEILARAKDDDEAIDEIRKIQDLSEASVKPSFKTAKHFVAKENSIFFI